MILIDKAVVDLRGGMRDVRPPGSKFFQFHAVFGKFGKIVCWHPPPGELVHLPRGNNGSTTARGHNLALNSIMNDIVNDKDLNLTLLTIKETF